MGPFLHRLGESAFHHKWRFLIGWLVTLGLLGVAAATFITPTDGSISIPGTEAQQALNRFDELFPDAGKGSGRLVFIAPNDSPIADSREQIDALGDKIAEIDGVTTVISPFVNTAAISENQRVAYSQVQLEEGNGSIDESTLNQIETAVADARSSGLNVEMGGDIINTVPAEILGVGEIGGVVIALVVLVMTLGSLIAAGMPIVIALVTVGVSMAGLFSLSQLITINATTPVLAIMLGLAVGIDYSLFIISRYRQYLLEGHGYHEAAGRAVGTAGNAVIFAAATVVIALSALTIVQIPFMTTMGLAGAATVALAAIVAVSLVPALLGFAGSRIFGGKTKRAIAAAQKKGPRTTHAIDTASFWHKWGAALAKRPILWLSVGIIIVVALALPARDLELGLPTDQYAASSSTQRKAYDALTDGFGVGFNGPLILVAENITPVSEADEAKVRAGILESFTKQAAAAQAAQEAAFAERAATITAPEQAAQLQSDIAAAQAAGQQQQQAALAQLEQQVQAFSKLYQLNLIAERIAKLDGVAQAIPALTTDDGKNGVIQVTPTTAPADDKTTALITQLRDPSVQSQVAPGGKVTFGVTGSTALQLDINEKLSQALPLYLGVVVGLSLLLLIVAFRSILIPLKATAGFLLSVLAMFGVLVAAFQWGWLGISDAPGPIVSFIPIIAIGILFGLAMDYEFFLVSNMHEAYTRKKDAKQAVVTGFGLGAKVVTAAGIIMVSVFAGFVFNHDVTIQAIGLGLAVGVLVDAFIVRMTIVPAVMTLLGKSAWWLPKWLDKRLPHVSIEGEAAPLAKTTRANK